MNFWMQILGNLIPNLVMQDIQSGSTWRKKEENVLLGFWVGDKKSLWCIIARIFKNLNFCRIYKVSPVVSLKLWYAMWGWKKTFMEQFSLKRLYLVGELVFVQSKILRNMKKHKHFYRFRHSISRNFLSFLLQ